MSLQELINQKALKEIKDISLQQIKKRFELAKKYFYYAKNNFNDNKEEYDEVVYTNLYKAAQILSETFLLLNGYKAEIKDHHKIVIQAAKLLMNDNQMDGIFGRLDKMRKARNTIDYDIETPSISKQIINQSILDTQKYIDKVQVFINKSDPQKKLME